MWGEVQRNAFGRDGHVMLGGAIDTESVRRMSEAVWRYVEARTPVRQDDRSTWPNGWFQISFKKLKGHSAFRAVPENPQVRAALDSIFGDVGWTPSKGGAQILFSFPDTDADGWRVPSKLWHMDAGFHRRVDPPWAVKMFTVVEPLPPRGGATMVLAGTPNLQADYARNAEPRHREGGSQSWRRFMARTDPWLASFAHDKGEPDRNEVLARPQVVAGHRVELRELCGSPGDVHLTHINLFHSGSPNANDRPRMLVTHVIHRADAFPGSAPRGQEPDVGGSAVE